MRKLLLLILIIPAIFLMASCEKEKNPEVVFDVTPLTLDFSGNGEEKSFKITAESDWEVIPAEWLSVSAGKGKGDATITVVAEENPTETKREGIITVKLTGTDKEYEITVNQGLKDVKADLEDYVISGAYYYGNGDLTFSGLTVITFSKPNENPNIHTILNLALYIEPINSITVDNVVLAPGLYTSDNKTRPFSLKPIRIINGRPDGSLFNEYDAEGDPANDILYGIEEGSLKVIANGDDYVLEGNFKMIDLNADQSSKDVTFKYAGPVKISNESYQLEYDNGYTKLEQKSIANYYGNERPEDNAGSNSGFFNLHLNRNIKDGKRGANIEAFMNLETDIYNLAVREGKYQFNDNNAPFTFLKGRTSVSGPTATLEGTYVYQMDMGGAYIDAILIEGGYFEVTAAADGKFSLKTNFTGTSFYGNEKIDNIKLEYVGDLKLNSKLTPAEDEFYGINFTSARTFLLDEYQSYGTSSVSVSFFQKEMGDDGKEVTVSQLDLELIIPYISRSDYKAAGVPPTGSFEGNDGYNTVGTFVTGFIPDDGSIQQGSLFVKNPGDNERREFIKITGGSVSISAVGDRYMLIPDLTGKNTTTNANVVLKGNFFGAIPYNDPRGY